MAAARVILVSDTHLSASAPRAQANWDAVVSYVGACAPDLVIHLGDLSLDGARSAVDLHHGRTQLDRLPAPWRAVPGNHDIGDNPWPGAPAGIAVDAARHQRWLDIVGADHWSVTVSGWIVLAINAQLLGSGLEAEAAQWSWLQEQIGGHRGRQPVALITHKPVKGYSLNRSGMGSCSWSSPVLHGRFAAGRSRLGGWPQPLACGAGRGFLPASRS